MEKIVMEKFKNFVNFLAGIVENPLIKLALEQVGKEDYDATDKMLNFQKKLQPNKIESSVQEYMGWYGIDASHADRIKNYQEYFVEIKNIYSSIL